ETTRATGAETLLGAAIAAESGRAIGVESGLSSAITAETARATAQEALKANLAGGNMFTGGSQALAQSETAYASLNVPNSTTPPSTPAVGDIWLLNGNAHLNFRTMNNSTEMLAFFSDITTTNAGTLTAANAYTDGQIATEAAARQAADTAETNARIAGDASTLSAANAHADAGDVTTLSSANTFTGNAVAAEAVLRAAGDAAVLVSANTYTDAEKARALAAEALKGNLAGGNNFTGGSQNLAASTASYPSFNVPNSATPLTSPSVGDIWLVNVDPHLNFRTMNNSTEMLAFFSDISTANAGTLASANSYTDAQVLAEKNRATGAEGTLTTNLSNETSRAMGAETAETTRATGAETLLGAAIATESGRAIGVESGLSSAITAETARATAQEALKANLAGGNMFTGGSQALAQSAAGYASSNVPNSTTPPSTTGASNVWLLNGNEHLNFRTLTNTKASLAGGNTFTGTQALGPLSNAASKPSNLFRLNANDASNVSQTAQLQALVDGSLSFQFGPTAGPISPKLNIDKNGFIT